GVVLFLAGATVAYLWVLPRALRVLFGFQQNVFDPIITAEGYFGFAAQIMIGFGVVTELPLVVVILAALGLVTPQFLARNRRYALVFAAFAAALLTPPDAVSMLLMMVPLVLLYEVSIWCAWVVTRRRARRAQAAARAGVVLLMLCGLGAGRLAAQGVVPRRRTALPPPSDSTARAGAPGTGAPHGQSLDAAADPRLFDQGTVLVGEGMRYDTCIRRGTVRSALTTFQQGGATWYTRGDLAVDSGSTRVYGASSEITSSDLPVPDYHFAAHE